ncbi:hypothetical protein GQ53DRAFT_285139 [Thozetella sp. PMI_491]|nr:hypothetical protein GQ53DRAFT_285139 [Thozetella sp. PMI_491]
MDTARGKWHGRTRRPSREIARRSRWLDSDEGSKQVVVGCARFGRRCLGRRAMSVHDRSGGSGRASRLSASAFKQIARAARSKYGRLVSEGVSAPAAVSCDRVYGRASVGLPKELSSQSQGYKEDGVFSSPLLIGKLSVALAKAVMGGGGVVDDRRAVGT